MKQQMTLDNYHFQLDSQQIPILLTRKFIDRKADSPQKNNSFISTKHPHLPSL